MYNSRLEIRREVQEIMVSFGLKSGLAAGVLCVSMAAHAEYKEVWNPPEAAHGAKHGKTESAARKSGAKASKPVTVKAAGGAGKPKTGHAAASGAGKSKTVHAAGASATGKPSTVHAATPAPSIAAHPTPAPTTAASTDPKRDLPPILH